MPAPVTIRQQIVNAVEARLETILTTGGYQTNLGEHVSVWRLVPFATSDLPAIDIRDKRETSKAQGATSKQEHRLEMECYIEVAEESTTAERARIYLADVQKAIGTTTGGAAGRKWSGLAIDTEPGESQMEIGQDGKIIGGIKFTFTIIYRTLSFDPYTAAN